MVLGTSLAHVLSEVLTDHLYTDDGTEHSKNVRQHEHRYCCSRHTLHALTHVPTHVCKYAQSSSTGTCRGIILERPDICSKNHIYFLCVKTSTNSYLYISSVISVISRECREEKIQKRIRERKSSEQNETLIQN